MASKKKSKQKRQFTDDQRKDYLSQLNDWVGKGNTKASFYEQHELSPNMVSTWAQMAKKKKWDLAVVPSSIAKAPASNSNAEVAKLREENKALKQLLKAAWG